MHPQNWMDALLGSVSRLRILRLLATEPGRTWTGREIAARVGMSPNTVNRALGQLRDAWVLDSQSVGPSKVVSLKTNVTLSATLREVFQVETAVMDRMKHAIARAVPPDASCTLFGSTARGTAHQGSDVDLLVVAPTRERAEEILLRVDEAARRVIPARYRPIALDAVSFRERAGASVYRSALKEGVRLGGVPLESFL